VRPYGPTFRNACSTTLTTVSIKKWTPTKLNQKLDNSNKYTTHLSGKPEDTQTAYPWTINLTNISFTPEELNLLNLGLQYSFQKPSYTFWKNAIIETEHTIRLLDDK
jgi:hypothetical protein